jgi:ABC-type glycerol-3-phosphate transport system permease component
MLAGRQTFPVTVGAIQFISYEQVLWGQMAAASLVAVLPQLILSLFVQKYIVRGLTMGAHTRPAKDRITTTGYTGRPADLAPETP